MSHADLRKQAAADHQAKLAHHAAGHAAKNDKAMIERAMRADDAKDAKQDKAMVKKAISQTKLRLATGGRAEDDRAPLRADRARGGRSGKGKGHKGTNVNIIVGHPGGPPLGAAGGLPPGALPPHPPMMPPPGAAPMAPPPPGAGAMMPPRPMPGPPVGAGVPGMRQRGGRAGFATGGKILDEAGAGTGEGRLEKIKDYGANADKGEAK